MTFHKYETLLQAGANRCVISIYSGSPTVWKWQEILRRRASVMAKQVFRDGSSSSSSSFSYGISYSPTSRSASVNAVQSPDQQSSGGSAQFSSPSSTSSSDGYSQSELSSFNNSANYIDGSNTFEGDSPYSPGTYQTSRGDNYQSVAQYGATVSNLRAAKVVYDTRELFAGAEDWEIAENATRPAPLLADSAGNFSNVRANDTETGSVYNGIDGNCSELPAGQFTGLEIASSPALIFPNFCFLDGCRRDYVFPTYQSWRSHTKNVHNKVIFCPEPLCIIGPFPNKTGLRRHIRSVHRSYKPYRCMKTTCPRSVKAWPRKDKLRDHDKRYHSNFKCFFSSHNPNHERWFDTDQELVLHTLSEHPGPYN